MIQSIVTSVPATDVVEKLISCLSHIPVLPLRMRLDTGKFQATAPILRGVWGKALYGLDRDLYQTVFHPGDDGQDAHALPLYVVRPAPPDPAFSPAVECILLGEAVKHVPQLLRAWDIAGGMGLATKSKSARETNEPFFVREVCAVNPDGSLDETLEPWTLDAAEWPLGIYDPCFLRFVNPLSLVRTVRTEKGNRKESVENPDFPLIVNRCLIRIGNLLPAAQRVELENLSAAIAEIALQTARSSWLGKTTQVYRKSNNTTDGYKLKGVFGSIQLPAGVGQLWPLLAAIQWLHVGKSTIVGMGQLEAIPQR